ncbi:MAG: hypothetical protein IKO16_02190 [Lachnospiraceae bacterium]|nr:hypothetical protein [Lachnospiraceae bacterium]
MMWMDNRLINSSYMQKKSVTVPRNVSQVISGFEATDRSGKPKTDVSAMRRALRNAGTQSSPQAPPSVIDGMKLYSMALKKARQTSKNTDLEKKKLKYSFKKISSKIISSKTSTSAREAVSQAKREVEKLKKAARTGKYDPEEIQAALDHAKAMERIARKKVKHLEEEEMARRCSQGSGGGNTPAVDTEGLDDKKDPVREEIDGIRKELKEIDDRAENEEYIESENVTNEMIDTITDGMEEMLDAIEELNDLLNELTQNVTDMDPEDIRSMEIKHRNKEMKEITKADAEYLKAMFEHYEQIKADGGIPVTSAPAAVVDVAL